MCKNYTLNRCPWCAAYHNNNISTFEIEEGWKTSIEEEIMGASNCEHLPNKLFLVTDNLHIVPTCLSLSPSIYNQQMFLKHTSVYGSEVAWASPYMFRDLENWVTLEDNIALMVDKESLLMPSMEALKGVSEKFPRVFIVLFKTEKQPEYKEKNEGIANRLKALEVKYG